MKSLSQQITRRNFRAETGERRRHSGQGAASGEGGVRGLAGGQNGWPGPRGGDARWWRTRAKRLTGGTGVRRRWCLSGVAGETACARAWCRHVERVEPLGKAQWRSHDARGGEEGGSVGRALRRRRGRMELGEGRGGLGTRYDTVGWAFTSLERRIG